MKDIEKELEGREQEHFEEYCEQLKEFGLPVTIGDNEIKFYIESFIQYDTLISKLHELHCQDSGNSLLLYRGVTNESYKLRSSLRVNHLQMYEDNLITDMYNSSPSEFAACKSDFEMIAKMQHYGLPTRFIDFTKNPYIALWFACQKDANREDANGLVYFDDEAMYVPRNMLDLVIKIIMKSAYETDTGFFYESLTLNERETYLDYLLLTSARFYVEPPKIDAREINQQSVFLAECNGIDRIYRNRNGKMTSIEQLLTEKDILQIKKYELSREDHKTYEELCFGRIVNLEKFSNTPLKKIIIPKCAKESILQELSYRGITRSFIFPTLNNIADEIKCDYLKEYPGLGEEEYE